MFSFNLLYQQLISKTVSTNASNNLPPLYQNDKFCLMSKLHQMEKRCHIIFPNSHLNIKGVQVSKGRISAGGSVEADVPRSPAPTYIQKAPGCVIFSNHTIPLYAALVH